MYSLETLKENYLIHCKTQKELNAKTIKAYHIDLKQFIKFASTYEDPISKECLTSYLAMLHEQYQPKTTKRKIASLKAFFHFLEYEDLLEHNPFNKMRISYREPKRLPKIIPANTIQLFLLTIYQHHQQATTPFQSATRSRRSPRRLTISLLIVPAQCARSSARISIFPLLPINTASSPAFTRGISVTSTIIWSIQILPTIGANLPLQST